MTARILAIAGTVAADAVRRRVVAVVLLFAAILALAIPSMPSYGVGVEQGTYREFSLALAWLATLIVALALSVGRIPTEIERRTVYPLLARGMARGEYVLGTWLGISMTLAGVVAAFTAVESVIALIAYGSPMLVLWQGALAIWMEMSVVTAFAVAVSAAWTVVPVAVASVAFLFIGRVRDSFVAAVGSPWVGYVYPSLSVFDAVNPVAHGSGLALLDIVGMIAAWVGWIVVLVSVAIAIFIRRDV